MSVQPEHHSFGNLPDRSTNLFQGFQQEFVPHGLIFGHKNGAYPNFVDIEIGQC